MHVLVEKPVTLLSHLPASILDLILSNSSCSYLIIKLWKTGNALLRNNLANGITYVNLRHHKIFESSYPRLLSCLPKLRTLSLYSDTNIIGESIDTWTQVLKHLPRTLESLSIDSPDSCWSILSGQDTKPRLLPLARMFPALRTLGLTGQWAGVNGRWPKQFPVSPEDFRELPPSLTCLKWNSISVTNDYFDLFAALPRSLTSLEAGLNFKRLKAEDCQNAPPNLTNIESLSVVSLDDDSRLPSSITKTAYWTLSTASIRALPPALISLNLLGRGRGSAALDDWLPDLPRGLTRLSLGSTRDNYLARHLLSLPLTLTDLSFYSSPFDLEGIKKTLVSTSLWLPRLKSLECLIEQVEPGFLAVLPRSLTHLSVTFKVEQHPDAEVAIDGEELPPLLSTLNVYVASGKACKLTSTLPSSLKSVRWDADDARKTLSVENIKKLPSSVTTLSGALNLSHDCPIDSSLFPAHLTVLNVQTLQAKWLAGLPRKLAHLNIQSLYRLSVTNDASLFEDLPPTLETIGIAQLNEGREVISFSASSFSSLPKLTFLYINGNVCYPSAVLRGLSRRLTGLTLPLESLEEVDLPFIPPLLSSVNFGPKVVLKSSPVVALHWPLLCGNNLNEPEKSVVLQRLRDHLSS